MFSYGVKFVSMAVSVITLIGAPAPPPPPAVVAAPPAVVAAPPAVVGAPAAVLAAPATVVVVAAPVLSFFELPHAPTTKPPTTNTTVAHLSLPPLGCPLFMSMKLILIPPLR